MHTLYFHYFSTLQKRWEHKPAKSNPQKGNPKELLILTRQLNLFFGWRLFFFCFFLCAGGLYWTQAKNMNNCFSLSRQFASNGFHAVYIVLHMSSGFLTLLLHYYNCVHSDLFKSLIKVRFLLFNECKCIALAFEYDHY